MIERTTSSHGAVDTGDEAVNRVVETRVVDTGTGAVLVVVDIRTVGAGASSSRMTIFSSDTVLVHRVASFAGIAACL